MVSTEHKALLERVGALAELSGVFGAVRVGERLEAEAVGSAEPAWYRVEFEDGAVWVGLVMEDRWLSESIEAELMHTGDKIEELLDEELSDQGFEGGPLAVEHFRSEGMLFTFRSRVASGSAETVSQCLLAYEACFRQLGDMSAEEED